MPDGRERDSKGERWKDWGDVGLRSHGGYCIWVYRVD